MRTRLSLLMLPLLVTPMLAGCGNVDQFNHPGTWKLPPAGQGANDANLRAMVANPNDLVAGADEPGSNGAESVRPVDLLLTGRRRPLPSVNASSIGASSGGAGQQGAAGGGGGAGGGGAGGVGGQ
jgi:hypothetical protein